MEILIKAKPNFTSYAYPCSDDQCGDCKSQGADGCSTDATCYSDLLRVKNDKHKICCITIQSCN